MVKETQQSIPAEEWPHDDVVESAITQCQRHAGLSLSPEQARSLIVRLSNLFNTAGLDCLGEESADDEKGE
ncbi:hypothetical protein CA54_41110 [Symmachiella macrocystis]|uniref:Uncharacterized protein n=1 Tax=Symmachiella macrocystis TaxID=2527985 RepID=A0A5C6BB25_9PLAN|nr:hypothetical protein CA54_41110 [Symmachiella macrocystis]